MAKSKNKKQKTGIQDGPLAPAAHDDTPSIPSKSAKRPREGDNVTNNATTGAVKKQKLNDSQKERLRKVRILVKKQIWFWGLLVEGF